MKKITPFPIAIYKDDKVIKIEDGLIYKLPDYCRKNCNKEACREQYSKLEFKEHVQFKLCHRGFLISYLKHLRTNYIFSGLVDSGDKSKNYSFFKKKYRRNQVERETVRNFIKGYEITENSFQHAISNRVRQVVQPYHDIKRLIGTIVANVEKVAARQNPNVSLYDAIKKLDDDLTTIYVTSQLIDKYTALTDSIASPNTLRSGRFRQRGLYKAFDKVCRIFRSKARSKRIKLKLYGNSYTEIRAYDSLDLLPFIILDNAIKYAIEDSEISIKFVEDSKSIKIEVENIGCYITTEDQKKIFRKFVRGEKASVFSAQGSGIGLYLASKIANHHEAKLNIVSEDLKLDTFGAQIGKTVVHLEFPLH